MNFPPYNSKTWSATDWINSYFAQYPDEFEVNPQTSLEGGDFIVLDTDRDQLPDHIRIVVGYGSTSTNESDYIGWETDDTSCWEVINPVPTPVNKLLINQHCIDRWHVAWDYNIVFENINMWYIHVIP